MVKLPSLGRRNSSVSGLVGAEACRVNDLKSRDFGFAVTICPSDTAAGIFGVVAAGVRVPRGCDEGCI